MAIPSGAPVGFFGTPDVVTVAGGTSSVANTAFSVAGDVVSGNWTNDDNALSAMMIAALTFSVAPTAGTSVNLYARLMDISGTNDAEIPTANCPNIHLGTFLLRTITTTQYVPLEINLPNAYASQVYQFYIENRAEQTLSAGWTLEITPKAPGPKA